MNTDELKNMLRRGFSRFYSEGYRIWSRKNVHGAINPLGESFELDSADVQRILKELEQEGRIKLNYQDDNYLEVLEPITTS